MPDEVKNDSVTVPETKSDKISVDIFGETVELPLETAKKIISKRDSKSKEYKDLSEKVSQAEKKATQEAERARLIELSRTNSFDELKLEASKEFRDKLDKVSSRIIKKELESSLLSQEDFIKDFKDDAVQLLQLTHNFTLDDAMEKVVGSDGKEVSEVVKEWLSKKDNFRKAKGTSGTGAKVGPQGSPANSGFEKFVDKLMKK
jgi:hypothetical protein